VAVSGQTSVAASSGLGTAGTGSTAIGIGYGDSTPGWDFTNTYPWTAIAVPVNGNGSQPIVIGGPGEGTVGTGEQHTIPEGTVIEHGDLSGKGGIMHDATQIEFDPTGLTNTSATDVQNAIEDLDGAISSGGMTNPMTTQDDLIVGGASGAPGRLAKGTDGQVLTVDPTTHHLVWLDPTTGGATALDDLTDVDTTTTPPSDGDVLTYDNGSSLWVPAAPTGGGGGGATIQFPALKPGTPTYDFAGASLHADFAVASQIGTFTTAHVMTQGAEWGGSSVELQYSGQKGQIYVAHANTDFDFTVGGVFKAGFAGSWMFGIAALNSTGSGVGITSYNDGNAYLATISS
jgi:hypothetical protein